MKKTLIIGLISYSCTLSLQVSAQNANPADVIQQIKPTLFADLGETCTTPDGMAKDQKGNLYLAVTNLTDFEKYGSKILTFDENDRPVTWFDQLPLHPVSGRVHPMGIEFGEDGNLYIADNQFFAGQKNQSRILRIVVENGKPVKAEVLVEGLNFANGIRINNKRIFVTDFLFENGEESGVYSFSMGELSKNKIILDEQMKKQHLISTFLVGIDGLTFDNNGNLYTGHFYTGEITKFELSKEGIVLSKKVVHEAGHLKCADGMYYDAERNSIFIASLSNNSVHQLDLKTNRLDVIWANDNNDGSTGLLDHPCETIIYKGNLIVVNFDTFTDEKNTEVDKFHTISKFKL